MPQKWLIAADHDTPTRGPTDYRGIALLVLSAAAGLALVLLSTAVFIRVVQS